jgi:activator of the mannose operon, transcriptional antiterminator
MNTRQKEVLFLLLSESDEHVLVQDLADRVNCSEKTIRNDFKAIEAYLTAYSSALLVRKPGLGVYLEIDLINCIVFIIVQSMNPMKNEF